MQTRLLTYTNSKGESITFSNSSSFFVGELEGLGDVEATHQSQNAPYQDGATYIDSLLSSRAINFPVFIRGENDTDISKKRTYLSKVFNPKLGEGILTYKYGDVTKEIKVVVDHVPSFGTSFENRGKRHQKGLIDLTAMQPYWTDVNPVNTKLEDYTGNFRFKFRAPGIRFAVRGDRRTLINDGDSPAPIAARFVGNAINPILKNETTGEFIKINYTIPDGFEMIISTVEGNKFVKLIDSEGTETNVFHYIDLNSTFFKLIQGENVISFITEGGNPDVYVEFKNQYLAI